MSEKKSLNLRLRSGGGTILNDPAYHSVASVSYRVQLNADAEEGSGKIKYKSVDSSMTISDCNKSIALDLSFSTPEMYENNQHKLDRLIQVLQECKAHMKEAKVGYDLLPEKSDEKDCATIKEFLVHMENKKEWEPKS